MELRPRHAGRRQLMTDRGLVPCRGRGVGFMSRGNVDGGLHAVRRARQVRAGAGCNPCRSVPYRVDADVERVIETSRLDPCQDWGGGYRHRSGEGIRLAHRWRSDADVASHAGLSG